MVTPPPILHADLPIEELTPPAFASGWKNPVNDAPLRIFRQGKRVFFTGMLVTSSSTSTEIFASPLPEGWRPAGTQYFITASSRGNVMLTVARDGIVRRSYGGESNGLNTWFPVNCVSYLAEN